MKTLLILLMLLVVPVLSFGADNYLACDWPTTEATFIGGSEVEINGTIQAGTFIQDGTHCLLLNLSGQTSGRKTFRARFISKGGWPSEWSLPFVDGKPAAPGGVYVVIK